MFGMVTALVVQDAATADAGLASATAAADRSEPRRSRRLDRVPVPGARSAWMTAIPAVEPAPRGPSSSGPISGP